MAETESSGFGYERREPVIKYMERRKITSIRGAVANSVQRAPLAQVSARLHGHIYRSRCCTCRRLDQIRSRQKNPIHAIEFKNIFFFPYLVIFSLKLECVFRFNRFHTIYFQQKAYGNNISASYPVPSRERDKVCGCSNSCRYPICCLTLFRKCAVL